MQRGFARPCAARERRPAIYPRTRPALSTPRSAMCEETRVIFLAQACIPLGFIVALPHAASLPLFPLLCILLIHLQPSLDVPCSRSSHTHDVPSWESGNRILPRDTTAPIKLGSRSHKIHLCRLLTRTRRYFLPSLRYRSTYNYSWSFSLIRTALKEYVRIRIHTSLARSLVRSSKYRCTI